jgi:hypothetical protein
MYPTKPENKAFNLKKNCNGSLSQYSVTVRHPNVEIFNVLQLVIRAWRTRELGCESNASATQIRALKSGG